ncbi:MAG: hypothetical protein E7C19_15440, partial [Klebsiella oxytoca]|nr:hypothetical protein [Klebsiella oxytoca]MDU2890082.1 hypothetical protein [Klebsiella oxytoca]
MKYCVLALSLASAFPAHAWVPQTGDIVFQISRLSQSKAIQLATHSAYSHTGMVVISSKRPPSEKVAFENAPCKGGYCQLSTTTLAIPFA